MKDAIAAYIDACTAMDEVQNRLTKVAQMIGGVGTALLQKPDRFIFSNVSSGLPMEAVMSRDSFSADGSAWPTAEQINQLLATWHKARDVLRDAWNRLAPEARARLVAHPTVQRR